MFTDERINDEAEPQPVGISSLALLVTEGTVSVLLDLPFRQVSCPLPGGWLDTLHQGISGDLCWGDWYPDQASSRVRKAVAAGLTAGHNGPTEPRLEAESVCLHTGRKVALAWGPRTMLMPALYP